MAVMMDITNPRGAGRIVTDYTTFKDTTGVPLEMSQIVTTEWTASAAIAKGDLVSFVVTATGTPLRVVTAVTSERGYRIVGVAQTAAAAGACPQIVLFGYCWVNVGSGTPAFGDWGGVSATAGQTSVNTGAVAATDVLGSVVGQFLGAKDSANLAPFWFTSR